MREMSACSPMSETVRVVTCWQPAAGGWPPLAAAHDCPLPAASSQLSVGA